LPDKSNSKPLTNFAVKKRNRKEHKGNRKGHKEKT